MARPPGARTWSPDLLIGGSPRTIEQTAAGLHRRFDPIDLKYRDGYLGVSDEDAIASDLVGWHPEIVLVAIGSPSQEILMSRLFDIHPALYMGLGGSFDVFVGRKARAPAGCSAWAWNGHFSSRGVHGDCIGFPPT